MAPPERALYRQTHETIRAVTADLEGAFHFNAAIARIMEMMNSMERFKLNRDSGSQAKAVARFAVETMVLLIAPLAPHIAEELWEELSHPGGILCAEWPVPDPAAFSRERVEIVLQLNGKFRGTMMAPSGADRDMLSEMALQQPQIAKSVKLSNIVKMVVVPEKLVNIVFKQ